MRMISIRKKIPVRGLGSIAAVATVVGLTLGLSMATAQAAPTVKTVAVQKASTGDRTHVLPAIPAKVSGASTALLPANSPAVSPSAGSTHQAGGTSYTCPSGNLCAVVYDPTTSSWEIFFLYNCARYSLSYWNGTGNFSDYQTGGVTSYFYGQSGNTVRSFRPILDDISQDWGPVWSIRNC